jgi:hypothetical protein
MRCSRVCCIHGKPIENEMYQLPTSDFFSNILHQPQSILPTRTNNFSNENLTTNSAAPVLLQRAARNLTDTKPPNQMTKGDASRIQAGQVKFSAPFMESVYWTDQLASKAKAGGDMSSNGFSAVLNLLVIEIRTSTLAPPTPLLDLAMLVWRWEVRCWQWWLPCWR